MIELLRSWWNRLDHAMSEPCPVWRCSGCGKATVCSHGFGPDAHDPVCPMFR